jgi:hypothetical protein
VTSWDIHQTPEHAGSLIVPFSTVNVEDTDTKKYTRKTAAQGDIGPLQKTSQSQDTCPKKKQRSIKKSMS